MGVFSVMLPHFGPKFKDFDFPQITTWGFWTRRSWFWWLFWGPTSSRHFFGLVPTFVELRIFAPKSPPYGYRTRGSWFWCLLWSPTPPRHLSGYSRHLSNFIFLPQNPHMVVFGPVLHPGRHLIWAAERLSIKLTYQWSMMFGSVGISPERCLDGVGPQNKSQNRYLRVRKPPCGGFGAKIWSSTNVGISPTSV